MAYFESVQQGDKGSLATEFFPSVCQGDSADAPANGFYESVMAVGSETYLIQFRADSSIDYFEIIRG